MVSPDADMVINSANVADPHDHVPTKTPTAPMIADASITIDITAKSGGRPLRSKTQTLVVFTTLFVSLTSYYLVVA